MLNLADISGIFMGPSIAVGEQRLRVMMRGLDQPLNIFYHQINSLGFLTVKLDEPADSSEGTGTVFRGNMLLNFTLCSDELAAKSGILALVEAVRAHVSVRLHLAARNDRRAPRILAACSRRRRGTGIGIGGGGNCHHRNVEFGPAKRARHRYRSHQILHFLLKQRGEGGGGAPVILMRASL